MRQAIILGVRPLMARNRKFGKIPLLSGGWRIQCENVSPETKLRLTLESRVPGEHGTFVKPSVYEGESFPTFTGPVDVTLEILEAGKEQYINVFAVAHDGP